MISSITTHAFTCEPAGPFDLADQNRYFGSWPTLTSDSEAIAMAFAIEGSEHAAAVVLRQGEGATIFGEVHGCPGELVDRARRQALAALSLDVDGSGWPDVGRRDPVIGRLQARYRLLRPTLFHSPYEAAAAFVIGHRRSIKQTRSLRSRIAAELGTAITVDGQRLHAFPTAAQLLAAGALPGIEERKTERLRAIARAAQAGWLGRAALLAMPQETALAKLQTLPGIGPFFAQGILYRGAGTVDTLTGGEMMSDAVVQAYALESAPDRGELEEIAEPWRPYRMWTTVLLNVWARRELRSPSGRSRPVDVSRR